MSKCKVSDGHSLNTRNTVSYLPEGMSIRISEGEDVGFYNVCFVADTVSTRVVTGSSAIDGVT